MSVIDDIIKKYKYGQQSAVESVIQKYRNVSVEQARERARQAELEAKKSVAKRFFEELKPATKKVAREFFSRPAASFGQEVLTRVTGKEQKFKPVGRFAKALYGEEEIRPTSSRLEGYLKEKGVDPKKAKFAGAALGVPLGLLEADPRTGLKQSVKSIVKDVKLVKSGAKTVKEVLPQFKGFTDLTTKILNKLKGKSVTSKQEILDFTNSSDLKQPERDLIRKVLGDTGIDETDINVAKDFIDSVRTGKVGGAKVPLKERLPFEIEARQLAPGWGINPELPPSKLANAFDNYLTKNKSKEVVHVQAFANKVKTELLPLKVNDKQVPNSISTKNFRYENVTLPDELRGPVANYQERIYESPIKTSAGDIHFSGSSENYFAHTRIEDLADRPITQAQRSAARVEGDALGIRKDIAKVTNKTRRVIELQSDLFQKGRFSELSDRVTSEMGTGLNKEGVLREAAENPKSYAASQLKREKEMGQLEPYRNTWHERVIREEVKQAAIDGKTKLQFPTGETAMKIEGLGETNNWVTAQSMARNSNVAPAELKVGLEIGTKTPLGNLGTDRWIITDILGDGKFKAVPKDSIIAKQNESFVPAREQTRLPNGDLYMSRNVETFDISGKVDTNNPIYRFYEKEVGRYLKNKYNATLITDPRGVKWWEVSVDKTLAKAPVEAFGIAAGVEVDEEGRIQLNPEQAALGVLGIGAIKGRKQLLGLGGRIKRALGLKIQELDSPAGKALAPLLRKSSYLKSTTKPTNLQVNVENFNISEAAKKVITDTVSDIRPTLELKVGNKLTNKEVLDLAEKSSEVLSRAVGAEQTLRWEVAMKNLRSSIAMSAQNETVDKAFIESVKILKSQGTDIARKLQSLSIAADARTPKEELIAAVLSVTDNMDEILRAAEGVDFNNFKQAANFYRTFVKPTAVEWIDLLRYNSTLSSPLTQIINAFSNLVNGLVVAPVEKVLVGGLDFLGTGERTQLATEVAPYLRGYFTSIRRASNRFFDVLAGRKAMTNLDTRQIPLATKGIKGVAVKTLSYPMRLLDATDQFFTELIESAETAALTYRKSKGITVGNIAVQAKEAAEYRLFRQDLFNEGQGAVLDAIDTFTSKVFALRNSPNPIVSTVAKFTVLFLKTPMNIFKQGVEFSPAGFATTVGARNKSEQFVRAAIGTAVFGGAALYLASDKLTWAEPTSEKQKNAWRAAGKQPYSVKFGDTWYSYQKLPPALAFPFAMTAALHDAKKNKKADDTTTDIILTSIAKWGEFLSDQSYARNFGDLLTAFKRGESGIARLVSNYPQQLIPYRALTGWLTRLLDDVQRKPDPSADFIDKQIQLLMMNYPGLSEKVPARTNEKGEPIPALNRAWNAVSPIRAQEEVAEFARFLDDYERYSAAVRTRDTQKTKDKEPVQKIYDDLQKMKEAGNTEQANKIYRALPKEQKKLYDELKSSAKTKATNDMKIQLFPLYEELQALKASGRQAEADRRYNQLSKEEKRVYQLIKKQFSDDE